MDVVPRFAPILLAAGICALAACSDSAGPDLTQSPYLFTAVAAGDSHTCGILSDSTLLCWGYGYGGQLGDGEEYGASAGIHGRPTPVPVKSNARFLSVTAGQSHTCALARDGSAYCWGSNFYHQLGSDAQLATLPTAVAGGLHFLTIKAGFLHTCAVAQDGAAYCWGANARGALGDGTTEDRATPTAVAGGHRFLALTAGLEHTCGLADDGAVYCWGSNRWGQLGDGTDTTRTVPTRVHGSAEFLTIAAGGFGSCGIARDHRLYCWGAPAMVGAGALDACQPFLPDYDGSAPCAKTPVAITTGTDFSPAALGVGGGHACLITDTGRIWCWGSNSSGQLGNGTVEDSPVPAPLAGAARFATVSASPRHTCAVGTEGVLYCWGDNRYGQLGDDSGALSWPVPSVVWGW